MEYYTCFYTKFNQNLTEKIQNVFSVKNCEQILKYNVDFKCFQEYIFENLFQFVVIYVKLTGFSQNINFSSLNLKVVHQIRNIILKTSRQIKKKCNSI